MQSDPEIWQSRLPIELQTSVIRPQRVEFFHDASVPASKWRGYDARGGLCYYRHSFSLREDVYEDEEPYQRLILRESLEAWRSPDGRWIRCVQRSEGPDQCRGGSHLPCFELVPSQAIPRI